MAEAFRDVVNAPKDVISVIDITKSPSFTESKFNEAQTVKLCLNEGAQGAEDLLRGFFDSVDSATTKDVTGLGNLEVRRKSPSSRLNEPSLSPKLINRFPAPSVDPDQNQSIFISILEDAPCPVCSRRGSQSFSTW